MKRILLASFALIFAVSAWAQERTISGKVTSAEDGSGLPGVNVVLKGTTTGSTTDVEGNYKFEIPAEGGTLVFSFIGLTTKEEVIGTRSVISIQMAEDIRALSEVVVTGYGIERAANEITYQTESLDGDILTQGQQQQAAAGLAGKVAGLQINVQSNGVNPQTQILLRGLRSISSNNEAMIIIDGSIANIGAFNDLNPMDIQNIDVLKGANAGALYGSRAANGAIIVTTKRGRTGQAFTVGLNSSLTFENVSFMPDFQTEHGIGWDGHYDRIENTNWGPRFDGINRPVGPSFPADYPVTDQVLAYAPIANNLRDFYETGTTFQNTAYVTGGSDDAKYYMSVGNVNTHGIVPDDRYERTTVRVNATQQMGKLEVGINSNFVSDNTDVVGDEIGDQDRTLYWFVLNTPANIPLSSYSDWDNPLSYGYADNYYNAYYQNPYWAVGTNRATAKTQRIVGNVHLKYDITDNINLAGRLGVNRVTGTNKDWRDRQTYNEDLQPSHATVSSFVEDGQFQSTDLNGNVILSGKFDAGTDFTINAFVGASFEDYDYSASTVRANNLSIAGFQSITNGTGELVNSVSAASRRTYGFFGDVTVGYKDYAYLNVAGRQDYTSTLPSESNSYFYPAVSANVILSNAIPAIADNNVISFAKVTVSNATVYNDLGIYALNERLFQPDYFPMGDLNGFAIPGTTVDSNIEKEKLNTWEFGLNLGFMKDRFSLNGSYFNTKTTDLITDTTPSFASGASVFATNIGELSSTGFEISATGNILKIGDFKWDVQVNYSAYESVIVSIREDIQEITLDGYTGYGTAAIVGEAFPQLKAQSYVRDPQGRVVIDPATGNPEIGGVVAMGKTTPDYIIGGTNQFSWKGFALSATVDFRTGHVYYSQGSDAMEFTGRSVESVSANRQDFVWPNSVIGNEQDGYVENTNISVSGGVMGFWQNSYNEIKENYVKDATAFKIRELAFNYTFPQSLLSRTNAISKLTIGFVGRNMWTRLPAQNRFSDPEFRNTRTTDDANGIGIGGYLQSPPTRSYGFNLNIEF